MRLGVILPRAQKTAHLFFLPPNRVKLISLDLQGDALPIELAEPGFSMSYLFIIILSRTSVSMNCENELWNVKCEMFLTEFQTCSQFSYAMGCVCLKSAFWTIRYVLHKYSKICSLTTMMSYLFLWLKKWNWMEK